MDEVFLKGQDTLVRADHRRDSVVRSWNHGAGDAQRACKLDSDFRQSGTFGQPVTAEGFGREIRVAQAKPVRSAQFSQRLHEAPAFIRAPPAAFTISSTRNGVDNG